MKVCRILVETHQFSHYNKQLSRILRAQSGQAYPLLTLLIMPLYPE